MRLRYFLILITAIAFVGCESYPKDVDGTLNKISNHTVRVGKSTSTTDYDKQLMNGFAKEVNAKVEWVEGDQIKLTELLSHHKIDMAIGGFTKESPLKKEVAFSKPYITQGDYEYVVAIPKGENALLMKLEKYIHNHGQAE